VGETCHVKGGDRRSLPVPALERIAADLEPAAERRQFRKGGVARGARPAGLPGVGRQRFGRPDADGEERRRPGDESSEGESDGDEPQFDHLVRERARMNRPRMH
jgi:hypothetical protein